MNNKNRYRVLQAIIIFNQSVHYFFHRTQFHIDDMKRSSLFSTNNIYTLYNNATSSRKELNPCLRIFRTV